MSDTIEIKISQLMLDSGTQARSKLDFRVIASYSEAMKKSEQFPPVVAFFDGSKYWLIVIDPYYATPSVIAKTIERLKYYYKRKTGRDFI